MGSYLSKARQITFTLTSNWPSRSIILSYLVPTNFLTRRLLALEPARQSWIIHRLLECDLLFISKLNMSSGAFPALEKRLPRLLLSAKPRPAIAPGHRQDTPLHLRRTLVAAACDAYRKRKLKAIERKYNIYLLDDF